MPLPTITSRSEAEPTARLFAGGPEEQVLLSCHVLGKPTAAQLFRLHEGEVSTLRQMQALLRRLSRGRDRMLNVINPLDIARPIRSLPYIYLDTTRSRRFIEARFGVPHRRVPPVPSRDWRFLRHDVELVDELVSFELTARRHDLPFGYLPPVDEAGRKVFPEVNVAWQGLTHRLRPQPDKTLLIGEHHVIFEHDCGEETIECGNVIRDATIGRKHLVYDQVFGSGVLQQLGWGKTIVVYIVDTRRGKLAASQKRVQRCLDCIPEGVDRARMYFTDRQSFLAAGDDIAGYEFLRGDGQTLPLPPFRRV